MQAVQRLGSREGLALQDLAAVLKRVEVRADSLELVLDRHGLFAGRHLELVLDEVRQRLGPGERVVAERLLAEKAKAGGEGAVRVSLPVRMQFRGGRTWVTGVQPAAGLRRPRSTPAWSARSAPPTAWSRRWTPPPCRGRCTPPGDPRPPT